MRRAAYLLSYPFLAAIGLAIGYGVLLAEKRLRRERLDREVAQEKKRSFWLAGALNEDETWPEASR